MFESFQICYSSLKNWTRTTTFINNVFGNFDFWNIIFGKSLPNFCQLWYSEKIIVFTWWICGLMASSTKNLEMTLEYRRSILPLHSLRVVRIFWIKLFNLPQGYFNHQAFKSTAKKTGLVFAQIQQLKVPQKVFTQRRLHHSNLQQAWNS